MKRTAKKSTMSPEQTTYALARAAYETVNGAYMDELRALGLRKRNRDSYTDNDEAAQISTETEIMALEAKHGVNELRDLLRAAENAMVDWSVAKVAPLATQSQMASVAEMRAMSGHLPSVRAKLIDLAFHLAS